MTTVHFFILLPPGGFGEVFRGRLSDGREVAVKRIAAVVGAAEAERVQLDLMREAQAGWGPFNLGGVRVYGGGTGSSKHMTLHIAYLM